MLSLPTALSTLLPVFEDSSDGIALVAPAPWYTVYANVTLARWLGLDGNRIEGQPLGELLAPLRAHWLLDRFEVVRREELNQAALSGNLLIDGHAAPVEVRFRRIAAGEHSVVAVVIRRKVPSQRPPLLGSSTGGDALTGLADRSLVMAKLAELLGDEGAADREFAVLFIDLDDFKRVNDLHGHLVGDRALREVAQRLADSVRAQDHVARFGGDEFVILLQQVRGPDEIEPVLARIHTALAAPIALPEGETTLSASIGVALASPSVQSPDELLAEADRAMYAAKRRRPDQCSVGS